MVDGWFCGLWFVVCGLWFVVYGLWFMVTVVCALWRISCGLWFVCFAAGPQTLTTIRLSLLLPARAKLAGEGAHGQSVTIYNAIMMVSKQQYTIMMVRKQKLAQCCKIKPTRHF